MPDERSNGHLAEQISKTMIDFELVSEYGGWETTAIPDDLEVDVRTETESTTIDASLAELLRAYAHVHHRKEGTVLVYTSTIEFQFDGDTCHLTLPTIEVDVPTQELSRAFETLFSEVFEIKDETDPVKREEQLEYVRSKLDEKGLAFDVEAFYEEVTS